MVLIALPKCPMCLAGYIGLTTGLSLPMAAAEKAQLFVMALCVLSLGITGLRWARDYVSRP